MHETTIFDKGNYMGRKWGIAISLLAGIIKFLVLGHIWIPSYYTL